MVEREEACRLCGQKATIQDWESGEELLAVENCDCGGFLIWDGLWQLRLPNLEPAERQMLSGRIRAHWAEGRRVKVATEDGKLTGPIVIESRGR